MEKPVILDTTTKTDAEYEAAVDLYLSGMRLIQEQMKTDRRESEALRAETDAILADIMQTLKAT